MWVLILFVLVCFFSHEFLRSKILSATAFESVCSVIALSGAMSNR